MKFSVKKPVRAKMKKFAGISEEGLHELEMAIGSGAEERTSILELQASMRTMVGGYRKGEDFLPPAPFSTEIKFDSKVGKRPVTVSDSAFCNNVQSHMNINGGYGSMLRGAIRFLGYPFLSMIQQDGLIRSGVENLTDDMVRKWITITGDTDKFQDDIEKINQFFKDHQVREKFRKLDSWTQYFGGGMLYIDMGCVSDAEFESPLIIDETLKKEKFVGLVPIEPINCYPAEYNSNEPWKGDYFVPKSWFVNGKKIHASRLMRFVDNEPPLLLKPSYNFFGMPITQIMLDYVAHFTKNRESAQRLLDKFSLLIWKTDMAGVLYSGGNNSNGWRSAANAVKTRGKIIANQRKNDSMVALDYTKESIEQVNTPLSGVKDLVEMSMHLIPAILRQPIVKFFGVQTKGYNIKEDVSVRNYYDLVSAKNETINSAHIQKVLNLAQVITLGKLEEGITFSFNPLWEMDAKETAEVRKAEAETDSILTTAGIVSTSEVRNKMGKDPASGFVGINDTDTPVNPILQAQVMATIAETVAAGQEEQQEGGEGEGGKSSGGKKPPKKQEGSRAPLGVQPRDAQGHYVPMAGTPV